MVFFDTFPGLQILHPQPFMLLPLVMWAALSFHQRGAALGTIMVALTALWGGAHQSGYFAHDFIQNDLLNYWLFVLVLTFTGIALSGLNARRLQSEDKLKEQLSLYDALIHAQSDVDEGVAVIEHGKIMYGNEAFWRIGGYAPGDIAVGSDFINLIHPSDRERIVDIHRRCMLGEPVPSRYEGLGLKKDGESVHIEIAVAKYRDGSQRVVVLLININERKRAEAALAESQQEYRELVESVQAIVWRAVPGGSFTFVSHEAEILLGYSIEEWTTNPDFWKGKIHPDDRDW